MPKPTTAQIRQSFIDYFVEHHGHRFHPSSPVIPHDDPTLLFANAGMNQFKPAFLGQVAPGSPLDGVTRATNTQKCIRAGGKHNDLEDVGKDTYHHTFFEMLGNWSFGDYFKPEAIEWAWDLLTRVYGLPGEQMYATYFEGDPAAGLEPDLEARDLWLRYLPAERVLPGNMKDNFWEMGETGPCGPCSELHFDRIGERDAAPLVNADDPDVIEIWNLVFIQYDRQPSPSSGSSSGVGVSPAASSGTSGVGVSPATTLVPLPAKHVDTGMGLERLASIIQGVTSNYDTDAFTPIFAAIERITHDPRGYHGKLGTDDPDSHDMAYRVIADHIRTLTFAITDGAVPSNEGRGYVLRRILRRGVRYGHQMLNAQTGFFSELVPVVVETMGDAFPELRKNPEHVIEVIKEEEESFGKTLDSGLRQIAFACANAMGSAVANGWVKPELERLGIGIGFHASVQPGGPVPIFTASVKKRPDLQTETGFEGVSPAWVGKYFTQSPVIAGKFAFELHDTYGFSIDLTKLIAEEHGFTVDTDGFEKCMAEQKERSRAAGTTTATDGIGLTPDAMARLKRLKVNPTDDEHKFHGRDMLATVKAIWNGHNFDEHATTTSSVSRRVGIILDKTNHYAEMGGQVTDHGRILVTRERRTTDHQPGGGGGEFKVEEVKSYGGFVVHFGHIVRGEIRVGDDVQLHLDTHRRTHISANHTATHLLNLGLRRVLGDRVDQKGSLVDPDRLRFDFSHNKPVGPDELGLVEQVVIEHIEQDMPVHADLAPHFVAEGIAGLRAVFGEAYPDPVRVVSIGVPVQDLLDTPDNSDWTDYSIEFCGGTHLASTGQAKTFALISETGIAKGIRRVEALTGVPAMAAHAAADDVAERLTEAGKLTGGPLALESGAISAELDGLAIPAARKADLRARLGRLQERLKASAKEDAKAKAAEAQALAKQIAAGHDCTTEPVLVARLDTGGDRAALQAACKTVQSLCPHSAVMLASVDAQTEKPGVALIAGVPPELVKRGLRAGDWIRETAKTLGGKGGGRPDHAQGGGPEIGKVGEALKAARTFAMRAMD